MTRNSRRLQKAVQAIFNDYREKASCPGQVYQNAACGCDNALQMWRGPKGEKGDTGPQGPKGDNAGSFLVDAEFVVNPQGQPEGAYLKLVLIDVEQQEQVVYVDLSYLTDIYEGGNGISIVDMVVAARLGAGLTFDQQGNIASAYQFCDGLDETSNVVKVRLDSSNKILGFASGTCGGLTATVGLAPSATGVNLVLTGADGAVLSAVPLNGSDGITVQKTGNGFTWLAAPAGMVSSQAGNQLSVSQADNKLYVGGNTLEYTFGTGAFTLKDSSGAALSSVTVPSAVRMLENMELRTDDGVYLHLTYLRDNGLRAYQDVSLDGLFCHDVETDGFSASAHSIAVPPGNWQTATLNEIGGRTVVWNQNVRYADFSDGVNTKSLDNATYTVTDGMMEVAITSDATKNTYIFGLSCNAPVQNHVYFITIDVFSNFTNNRFFLYPFYDEVLKQSIPQNVWTSLNSIFTHTRTSSAGSFFITTGGDIDFVTGNFMKFRNPRVIDLTLMFGAGNEPATVEEFEAMFPTIDPAYNAGELKSAGVTEVVSDGENVMPPPAAGTTTVNGITAVSDGSGTVTISGTASSYTVLRFDIPEFTIPLSNVVGGSHQFFANNSFAVASGATIGFYYNNTSIDSWELSSKYRTSRGYRAMGGRLCNSWRVVISVGTTIDGTIAPAFMNDTSSGTARYNFKQYFRTALPVPAAVQALPGYGWSAGTVYNYVDYARKVYVQRVGAVDLGALTWSRIAAGQNYVFRAIAPVTPLQGGAGIISKTYTVTASYTASNLPNLYSLIASTYWSNTRWTVIRDDSYTDAATFEAAMSGVMLYYELATPVETDITSLLTGDNLIEVEPGGSLTFAHGLGNLPVPVSGTYVYERPWVFEDCVREAVLKELEPYSSSIADVSASFECRAVAQPIAPAFSIRICDYWDDGESDGCYSSDYLGDTLDFSILSGVETKLGTLSLANNTPDNPVVSFSMGDETVSTQTPLTMARRELLVSGDVSAIYASGASYSVSSLAVGDSLAFEFSRIMATEYNGTYYILRYITLDAPAQAVEIPSEILGTFTISARVVREPDVDGKFTVSFYATATLADASTSTVPTLTLTTTDVSGETHEQEIDMSCILDTVDEKIAEIPQYEGATASADGTDGLVPAATSSERTGFLKGNGTWDESVPVYDKETYWIETDGDKAYFECFYHPAAEDIESWNLNYIEVLHINRMSVSEDSELPLYLHVTDKDYTVSLYIPVYASHEDWHYHNICTVKKLIGTFGYNTLFRVIVRSGVRAAVILNTMLPQYEAPTDYMPGRAGLVPAAAEGETDKYLKSDGTWTDLETPITQNASDIAALQTVVAGKADSADVPAASDAVPQPLGTADAGVSAAYSRADHVHELPAQIAANTAAIAQNASSIASLQTKTDITDKNVSNIQALLNGTLYREEMDSTMAYSKAVPTGAMPYATLNEIGGRTVVWNQLVQNGDFSDGTAGWWSQNASLSVADGIAAITGTGQFARLAKTRNNPSFLPPDVVAGHTYIIVATMRKNNAKNGYAINFKLGSKTSSVSWGTAANTWQTFYALFTTSSNSETSDYLYIADANIYFEEGFVAEIRQVSCFDLTLMFGAGNEPATVEEFEAMFPTIDPAYNAGELKSAGVTEVVSEGRNLLGTERTNIVSMAYSAPTTQRTFTENDVWVGISGNGYTHNTQITAYSIGKCSVSYTTSSASYGIGFPINVKPNTTYTVNATFSTGAGVSVGSYKDGYYQTYSGTRPVPYTFTTANEDWVVIVFLATSADYQSTPLTASDIRLYEGSTATEYTPYRAPISLPIPAAIQSLPGYGWSAGTAKNYIDFERKVYVQEVGSVDLGTLNWSKGTSTFWTNSLAFSKNIQDNKKANILCSAYVAASYNDVANHVSDNSISGRYPSDGKTYLNIYNSDAQANQTAVEFKASLSGVMLYYALATPIETDISSLLTGDNLIEVEAGGSLTFKNQHGDDWRVPVPNEETYIIDIQEAVSNG